MKNLRRLFRGFLGLVGSICILGLVMLILTFACGGDYLFEVLLFYFLIAFLVFMGILIFGIVVLSQYEKAKQKLYAIPGFSEERFARETSRAPKIKNMVLCSDAICYYGNTYLPKTIAIQEIVWAYQGTNPREEFGLVLCLWDGEKVSVPVKAKLKQREAALRYVLRLIARKNKGVLLGYREEYENLFCRNRSELLAMVQEGGLTDSNALEQEYVQNDYYKKDFQ